MQDYLPGHEGEVVDMIFTEWNWDDALDVRFEEGVAEGIAEGEIMGKVEGRIEGKEETARNMKAKGYPVADIAEITGLSIEEIEKL
jgi:predicted transposase/invertase (TIGR01784 family)